MRSPYSFLLAAPLMAAAHASHAAPDAAQGQVLYQAKCSACHSVAYNGVGPAHQGVFGRQAGKAPGYAYSPALKAATLHWDAASLDRWLANPEAVLPGQKMGYSVPDAGERAALIAYLRTLQP